ncbi:MAG TPA: LysM peptidoglycan-binding domain-containing protein [Gemmatimonadales bacterium]
MAAVPSASDEPVPQGESTRPDETPVPVVSYRILIDSDEPSRPRPVAARGGISQGLTRVPVHLLTVALVAVVVAGGGFWSASQTVVRPGGTDQILHVNHQPFAQPLFIASTMNVALPGYLSTAGLAVTPERLKVETYRTHEGETIADVAAATGRSAETLLWANNFSDPAKPLGAGTQLRIPPTDGVLHVIHDGDTLESIAARYGVTVEAITSYEPNGVERTADLVPYQTMMVPGGEIAQRDEVVTYTVREGDTLWSIADRFGLQAQTILWANNLDDSDVIVPGQRLAILPTDGVMVQVQSGDTIESLAAEWGVDPSAIRDYPQNGLGAAGSLVPGSYVMIPGGHPPAPPPPPAPEPPPAVAQAPESAGSEPVAEPAPPPPPEPEPEPPPPPPAARSGPSGWFMWPANGVITQYFHGGHNGWDIANGMYTPIVAADSGTVTFAGWNNYGLGYCVSIDHGNGFVTWYGHMAEPPAVSAGQWVEQGQYIGPMGSTGNSTGPHVHFIVVLNGVYQNPGNYLD